MIDLNTDAYTRYRGECMVEGAKRILACEGVIISFNGEEYDLPRLARLAGLAVSDTLQQRDNHYDMQVEASRDRWPPRLGTAPIVSPCLRDYYRLRWPRKIGQFVRAESDHVAEYPAALK